MNNNEIINKDKVEKKAILIIIAIIIILLLISIYVILFISDNNLLSYPVKDEPKKELSEVEAGTLINYLMLIGIEIYEENKYQSIPKTDFGYYFTKGQLKDMGYDNVDSLVDSSCTDNHAILFIDIDHPENYPDGYPIFTVYDCSDVILGSN